MKDFRPRVVKHRPDLAEVMDLLRHGQLAKALRKARAVGFTIAQEDIDLVAKTRFRAGSVGELLALIGRVDVKYPFSTNELLVRAFDAGDHHTFLKQVHRLGAAAGLELQVEEAISAIARRAPNEAIAWRQKFTRR